MIKRNKKIAAVLCALFMLHPLAFAFDSELNKDIIALELEIQRIKTKSGEYADMTEKELEKELEKAQKKLEKKKAKAKKEASSDKARLKEGTKKAGKDIKEAGKKAGKELKEAGKEIGDTFKDIFE